MATVKPIPDRYHSLQPHLVVRDVSKAIEFYKKAFAATELHRMTGPDGRSIMHAELRIGDSILMLTEEMPAQKALSPQALNGSPVTIHLYVENVDAVFSRALAAGSIATMPVQDMFWGDRFGRLVDPFGHSWSIATHQEDVSEEQMRQRAAAEFQKMAARRQGSGSA